MNESLYVYAIVARGAELPSDVTGLLGDRLTAFACRDLAAVISKVEGGPVDASAERVLRHETVVEAVRRMAPALPARFGTILPDGPALERALSRRYVTLAADLRRLGDKLEYGLTVLQDPGDGGNDAHAAGTEPRGIPEHLTGAGSMYLRTRAEAIRREDDRRARAEVLAGELDKTLGRLALEQRRRPPAGERLVLRTAYLVDPRDDEAFRAAFEGARRMRSSVRFLLSGPWPPYSFVSRDDMGSLLTEA